MRSIRVSTVSILFVFLFTALVLPSSLVQAAGPLAGRVIVIDPGHGGEDPGAVVNGFKEKDVNIQIALKLKALLESAGATTVYTRVDDSTLGTSANRRRSIWDSMSVSCSMSARSGLGNTFQNFGR